MSEMQKMSYEERNSKIETLYAQNYSCQKIADILDNVISGDTVRYQLLQRGITLRSPRERTLKFTCGIARVALLKR